MTTNKPEVFEIYRTRQGTLEKVVLLADYEALQAERDQQYAMKIKAREQRDAITKRFIALKAEQLETLKAVLDAAKYDKSEREPVSHDWDDQDKCRRCGDRVWCASATCTPKQQEKQNDKRRV